MSRYIYTHVSSLFEASTTSEYNMTCSRIHKGFSWPNDDLPVSGRMIQTTILNSFLFSTVFSPVWIISLLPIFSFFSQAYKYSGVSQNRRSGQVFRQAASLEEFQTRGNLQGAEGAAHRVGTLRT